MVLVAIMIKCSHSKQTVGELYEIPDADMEENEVYETNTQTQHTAMAANEAYGCGGDIPVIENVAYTPAAAVDIPTVQNMAYGRMNGAAVNTDTEEQNEMYDYIM